MFIDYLDIFWEMVLFESLAHLLLICLASVSELKELVIDSGKHVFFICVCVENSFPCWKTSFKQML